MIGKSLMININSLTDMDRTGYNKLIAHMYCLIANKHYMQSTQILSVNIVYVSKHTRTPGISQFRTKNNLTFGGFMSRSLLVSLGHHDHM